MCRPIHLSSLSSPRAYFTVRFPVLLMNLNDLQKQNVLHSVPVNRKWEFPLYNSFLLGLMAGGWNSTVPHSLAIVESLPLLGFQITSLPRKSMRANIPTDSSFSDDNTKFPVLDCTEARPPSRGEVSFTDRHFNTFWNLRRHVMLSFLKMASTLT